MTPDEMARHLEIARIMAITADEWDAVAGELETVERHATGVAGVLVLVRIPDGFVAVEEPSRDERVVRRLATSAEARRFVAQRLEQYERMGDGCGCSVDYYR